MDQETRRELNEVKKELKLYRQDSRHLLLLTESVRGLSKKVDRYTMAITGLATTFAADVAIRLYTK